MKFWEKIFICTLIIFQIFFVPACIYLINSNFKLNLQREVNSGLSEHYRICSSIESNLFLLKMEDISSIYENKFDKKYIDSMISTYLRDIGDKKVYLQVIDENSKVIFSDLKVNVPKERNELNTIRDKANYIIRDIDKKSYLFIAKEINLDSNHYKVSYIKEVSIIYENRKYMFNLLIKLNIFITIILAIVMIALSKFIVKPINKLIKSTQTIACGNFSERVNITSDDEIGLLSKNFNIMGNVIEDKIAELEKVSENKQRFIDNLTHEMRTPLTSIIGYTDFLRTIKYEEETFITLLGYVYEEGKRLEKLTFKLMDLMRLRKEDFNMKSENIKELLLEVKNSLVHKLECKNIELEVSTVDCNLLMDKDLIHVLITNFVDNAVKASKPNDKIYLNAYKDEQSNLVIQVKDIGVGIPKDDIAKIIEPFYMVDKSRDRRNDGVGLGLSICAEIAKVHNAEIFIKSELKKGTTVGIIFKI